MTRRLPLLTILLSAAAVSADEFTVRITPTESETFEAAVYGQSEAGDLALIKADGSLVLTPPGAVTDRKPGEDPTPLTHEEMADKLRERFGEDLTRTHIAEPFVVALKLAAPIDPDREPFLERFFTEVEKFVLKFDDDFSTWSEDMGLPNEEPAYPLVMVIFETDEDFEVYAKEMMGDRGLSAGVVSGFYSGNNNWLAVRLDECDNFQLPLHEGIHQQVYNRGWYKRAASVPKWFNEGIATGFEADGNKLRGDPRRVSAEYATRSSGPMELSFGDVIRDDSSFGGDVTAGEAYTRAWALHWLVVNDRKEEYVRFVKELGKRNPLDTVAEDDRVATFESTFNLKLDELQPLYERELVTAARKQRVKPVRRGPDGRSTKQDQGGLTSVFVSTDGAAIRAYGELRNISPFRALDFRVRVEPSGSAPIEWIVEGLAPRRKTRLKPKVMAASAKTFRVEVQSALPGSEKSKSWGRVPFATQ